MVPIISKDSPRKGNKGFQFMCTPQGLSLFLNAILWYTRILGFCTIFIEVLGVISVTLITYFYGFSNSDTIITFFYLEDNKLFMYEIAKIMLSSKYKEKRKKGKGKNK